MPRRRNQREEEDEEEEEDSVSLATSSTSTSSDEESSVDGNEKTPTKCEEEDAIQLGEEASSSGGFSKLCTILKKFKAGENFDLGKTVREYLEKTGKVQILVDILDEVRPTDCFFNFTRRDSFAPFRATPGSVGYDLSSREDARIPARERQVFHLGVAIQTPGDYMHCEIKSRSGLSCKMGIEVVGSGIIDTDYDRELTVVLVNNSQIDYMVKRGNRIAQLVFRPYINAKLLPAPDVEEEEANLMKREHESDVEEGGGASLKKRKGGFGSTGR